MKVVSGQWSVVGRFFSLAFISFSLAIFVNGQTASAQPLVNEFDVNGLKVIVKRRPSSPTVSVGLFTRGGVRNQTAQNAGIEGLTLSAATESSKNFPREALRREMSRMGSTIGSGISYDFGVISLSSTRQNFERSWEIFSDVVMNPTFAPEDVTLARERILTGLRNQSVSPDSFLGVLQDKIIYAQHPYATDPNGTVETVSALKAEDLRAYHKSLLQTSRLLLVIVGDLDAQAVQKQVAASFGKLPRGDYKDKLLPPLDFSKATLDVTPRTVETNYVRGIFAAPSLGDPDYHAMRVAITLLQSRVYQEVRTRRNLSYAPNAEMENNAANTANIYVTAVDANQAVAVMLREIEQMKAAPPEPDDFSGVPGFFLTTYYINQETNAAQVAELARYELIGGGWRNSLAFLDKVRQVTPADVQRVAQKYMKNLRFVVVGNPSAISRDVFLPKS
jgi:zinc protease